MKNRINIQIVSLIIIVSVILIANTWGKKRLYRPALLLMEL